MAPDEEEDLYDDEFDFVDDDDEDLDEGDELADEEAEEPESEFEDPSSEPDDEPSRHEAAARHKSYDSEDEADRPEAPDEEEKVDEFGRPEPEPNYVVHIYEYRQFKRTIDRPFTGEDAEAFASEYNRTSKSYGRFAVAGKNDAKPRKTLD